MKQPWYQAARRWCQTNLTEIDARDCDVEAWRQYWRRNRIDGIIVNAGGIVAYYPSECENQYRSPYLGKRDLFGEFAKAAREEGIAVIARMDINRVAEDAYRAHPQWFAQDAEGRPYRAGDRYLACVNGAYDREFVPRQLREICRRYAPDAFSDNSWQGPGTAQICYCGECRESFQRYCGRELPRKPDWDDETYRFWVRWSVQCRMDNWDLYNRVVREGAPDCLWLGMVNADPVSAHCALYDLQVLGKRSPALMVDHQCRDAINGFEQNLVNGLLLHGVCGAHALLPESMAHYARGVYTFRRAAMPPLELRMWMLCGIAGGLSPWLHIVGAVQEDRRMLTVDEPLMAWHAENQQYLEDREPIAEVGLVWSQQNVTFYGRDRQQKSCALPWRGFTRALVHARIPFVPVCAEELPEDTTKLKVLIFPDVAVLTGKQTARLERFLRSGGHTLVTGRTGMMDEWGEPLASPPLDAMLGLRRQDAPEEDAHDGDWSQHAFHNYLRIDAPEHPVMQRFSETTILPFGGRWQPVAEHAPWLERLMSYIPTFPIYPPEFAYMREPRTALPMLLTGVSPWGGRIAYLAADIDRRYGEAGLPDHGDLLEALVCWLAGNSLSVSLEGPGYVAMAPYRQGARRLVHLVNLSGLNVEPGFAEECYPVGPLTLRMRAPSETRWTARSLVGGKALPVERDGDWLTVQLPVLGEHDLVLLDNGAKAL